MSFITAEAQMKKSKKKHEDKLKKIRTGKKIKDKDHNHKLARFSKYCREDL